MKRCIIAVDPGASGGIAFDLVPGVWTHPMPAAEGDIVDMISAIKLASRLEKFELVAVVEMVCGYIGRPQPGSAMFSFGRNFGFILGVFAALKIPVELVRPQKWQKALSLGTSAAHASKTAWKNHLKAEAQRRFPDQKVTLATADALLLLSYFSNKNHAQ